MNIEVKYDNQVLLIIKWS